MQWRNMRILAEVVVSLADMLIAISLAVMITVADEMTAAVGTGGWGYS